MWRLAALILLFCAGCASSDSDNLVAESWLGDMRSLFNSGRPSVSSSIAGGSAGYVGNPSTAAPAASSSQVAGDSAAAP
jgi:hypothetical protein